MSFHTFSPLRKILLVPYNRVRAQVGATHTIDLPVIGYIMGFVNSQFVSVVFLQPF
jgi:hypothetical protein